MYVQINKSLRDQLHANVVARAFMGSHAYGLNGPHSDLDVLYLYYDGNYGDTMCWERNGWQYKTEDGVDENYQEIRHYIQNLVVGESPADYEALRTGFTYIQSAGLIELFDYMATRCVTYTLMKSYLGYIKKDFSRFSAFPSTRYDSRDLRKSVSHLVRGESILRHLMGDGNYQFTTNPIDHGVAWSICNNILHGVQHVHELSSIQIDDNSDDWTFLSTPTEIMIYSVDELRSFATLAHTYSIGIREALNSSLNDSKITRRMSVDVLRKIDHMLYDVVYDLRNMNCGQGIDYGDLRYVIIEKGVTHQYVK